MKFFNIEFKGYLKDIDALPKNDLAKKYNRLENSNDINEIMKQIYIYAIPLGILFMYFVITFTYYVELDIICFFLILFSSLIMMPVHELLHAIAMPCKSKKYIYFFSQGMLATTTDIISRRRYIFMSMLPNIVLGIIPIILYFVAVNANCKISPGILCFGVLEICYGIGDYWNVLKALNVTSGKCQLFNSGVNTFYIGKKSDCEQLKIIIAFISLIITVAIGTSYLLTENVIFLYLLLVSFVVFYMIENQLSIIMRYSIVIFIIAIRILL